jgi:putative ABC transport system permease protein
MWRDLRYAVGGLWRSPGFTVAAVAALGLAIGANATIFGLVDGLWLRPPGISHPDRLDWILSTTADERSGSWSYPEYETLRDRTSSFAGVIARGRRGAMIRAADGTSELLLVNVVSTNFFSTLGVTAAAGRLFGPADDAALSLQPGVVLSHSLWQRRFGADPAIVGTTINLMRGEPLPVVVLGVLPDTFRELDAAADRDLWMPPQTWMLLENRATFERRTDRWFEVLAIRAPGIRSARAAQPDVENVARQLALAYPETNAGRAARVMSDLSYRLEEGGVNAKALLGLVLLVVLITSVNVANLLLARGAARSRELAVRAALGATRGRLLRQMLIESAALGTLGALAGLTFALWLIRLLPSILVAPPGFRSVTIFQTDARVLAFTLAVSLITTLLFGTAPSWLAARADVMPLIKEGAVAGRARRADRVLGPVLVIAQVAVSLVLLCGAALLARSFIAMQGADVGLRHTEVVTAWVAGGEQPPSQSAYTRDALRRLAALPGVAAVAVAIRAPLSLSGGGLSKPLFLPDRPLAPGAAPPAVKFNAVSRDYFKTLGTQLIAGRLFDAADEQAGEPVVVVNQEVSRHFFPAGNALGAQVRVGTPTGPLHRIVGIVQNAVINSLTEPPEPYFYLPYWRAAYGEATFLVQAADDAAALAPAVRATLKNTDPSLEPKRLITMHQYIEYSGSGYRATALLASTLGAVGLLLTVLGVYGVVAYRTTRRSREIGIRMALGASRPQVLRLVLREGATLAAAGIALGIPLALLSSRAIGSFLYGTRTWDVAAFGGAAALLFTCVWAAAFVPARRAMRLSPSMALKE